MVTRKQTQPVVKIPISSMVQRSQVVVVGGEVPLAEPPMSVQSAFGGIVALAVVAYAIEYPTGFVGGPHIKAALAGSGRYPVPLGIASVMVKSNAEAEE